MSKIKVGISIGDLNGIGLETIIKTFKDKRMLDYCIPIVFGSSKVVAKHKKAIEINDFNFNIINKIEDVKLDNINLLHCLFLITFFDNYLKCPQKFSFV